MDNLLVWLEQSYSNEEIERLVIPAFDKRLNEYADLFEIRSGEDAQAHVLRTFKRIVENVFCENEAHIAQIMAAIFLWWESVSQEGSAIVSMDKNSHITW